MLIEELEQLAREELMPAIRELVAGVTVQQSDSKGRSYIYTQPPNAQMVIYVTDRILGKMPTRIAGEKDEEGNEQPIPLRIIP